MSTGKSPKREEQIIKTTLDLGTIVTAVGLVSVLLIIKGIEIVE